MSHVGSMRLMMVGRQFSTSNQLLNQHISRGTRLKNTMDKMLKREKRKNFQTEVPTKKFVDSATWSSTITEKKVNPKIVVRERRVAGVLMKDLTELIQSCQIGEEIYLAGVKITDVVHSNKANVVVLWELVDGEPTTELNDFLNSISSRIRHHLISANTIGQVPKLQFRIDAGKRQAQHINAILDGLPRIQQYDHDDEAVVDGLYEEMRRTTVRKATQLTASAGESARQKRRKELSMDMFSISQTEMMEKIQAIKRTSKNRDDDS